MKKLSPVFGSSTDPSRLALTWKGAIVALIPLTVILLKQFGVELDDTDLTGLLDATFSVASASMIAYGLFRKLYYKLKFGKKL